MRVFCQAMPSEQGVPEIRADSGRPLSPKCSTSGALPTTQCTHAQNKTCIGSNVKTVSNSLHIQHTSFVLPSTSVMELLLFSYNFSFFGQSFKMIKLTTLFRLLTHFLYIHKHIQTSLKVMFGQKKNRIGSRITSTPELPPSNAFLQCILIVVCTNARTRFSVFTTHSEPENTKKNTESELILYIQIHCHNPSCIDLINCIWRALTLLCVDGVILLLLMLEAVCGSNQCPYRYWQLRLNRNPAQGWSCSILGMKSCLQINQNVLQPIFLSEILL